MFKDKTYLADVAIELDIRTDTVLKFHADYLRPVQMDGLFKLYNDLKNERLQYILSFLSTNKERAAIAARYHQFDKRSKGLKFLENVVELYIQYIQGQ
jgi:hypothetical protein